MSGKYFGGIFKDFHSYSALLIRTQSIVQVRDHQYQHSSKVTQQLPFTCDLRIYETAGDEGWNSIRRAILTGTAPSGDGTGLLLWCTSYCRLPSQASWVGVNY